MANYRDLQAFANSLNDYCNQDDISPCDLNPWQDVILGATVRGCEVSLESVQVQDGSSIQFDGVAGQVFFSQHLNEWCITADAEDFSYEDEF